MTTRRRVLDAMGVVALAASGLVLGPGAHPAAAVPGEGDPPDHYTEPPVVQNVRVEGNTAYITFV